MSSRQQEKSNTLNCKNCNQIFLVTHPLQKYCSKGCRWSFYNKSPKRNIYNRLYKQTWREDNRERHNEIQRDWWKNLKDKQIYALRWRLKSRYGLTIDQYTDLKQSHNNRCAICNRHEDEFKYGLSIDHNHSSGEIRGLLCWSCNSHLIGKNTDPELFRKAADYLEIGHTGLFVPKRKRKRRKKRK